MKYGDYRSQSVLPVRQQRSKVLLTSLHEWMVEKNGTLSKKSRLGEAFSYVLNQWDALPVITVMTVWRRRIIMLRKERLVQSVSEEKLYVLWQRSRRRAWSTVGHGLIGTCRLNGIDPEAYLRHILSVPPEWPSNRVDELLPRNVVLTNK